MNIFKLLFPSNPFDIQMTNEVVSQQNTDTNNLFIGKEIRFKINDILMQKWT